MPAVSTLFGSEIRQINQVMGALLSWWTEQ